MTSTSQARKDLLDALQPHVAAIAENLRARIHSPTHPSERIARQAAVRLHADEGAGDAFDLWLDLLGRRAAVLWVLKLVYIRVLEDRGLIRPRVIDPTHQELFERLAPSLGESAFLGLVFRDLAQENGGLPELFAPQPAEVLAPADAHTRDLLKLMRSSDPQGGGRRFDFTDERFDGQLLGDLYQELDPVVKERFALLQTPDFVRSFILDRTLGEALNAWPADQVRVIDPACGSGHFLIDALRRLANALETQHPTWTRLQVVTRALTQIVGVDLNDYAAALARARLVMTALELSGEGQLAAAGAFHPHVYWADGLEQVEREDHPEDQLVLGTMLPQVVMATLTPSETRRTLRRVLAGGFQVVVANPPYITEKDEARKRYHKEKSGAPKRPRYLSAAGKYSLGAPFTERCFQLAAPDGFVGLINTNAFAKREFGVPLVEQVLANVDLTLIVDTSGAYIPGHGTPTLLLFGRNRRPRGSDIVAVLGKRGEPSNPPDPAKGRVWTSILAGWDQPGFDDAFVSTERVQREVLAKHPWSLRGGGALALQQRIAPNGGTTLKDKTNDMGFDAIMGEDDIYLMDAATANRRRIVAQRVSRLVEGESVRDWAVDSSTLVVFPYQGTEPVDIRAESEILSYLQRYRIVLSERRQFGKTAIQAGLQWFEYRSFYVAKRYTPLTITFAFVATHNHFVLDRGGKVFKQTAPVIKLAADATADDHLALLGPLNSSTACFWMKQVCFDKGGGGDGWEQRFEHDSTKLARFPLPPSRESTLPWARALDALGHARAADTVAATLSDLSWTTPQTLRALLQARRDRDLGRLREMVALQEELDWLVYRLYGLVPPDTTVLPPGEAPPLTPGQRPFELDLAAADAAVRAALARGETPDDTPTAWFERHGWSPCMALPADTPPATASLVAARRALTASTPHLRLLEAPVHKRRWYNPDFAIQERDALTTWLLDRLEEALAPLPRPTTPRALARLLLADLRFLAVAALLEGVEAPDLGALCARLLSGDSVAAHPRHRYTAKGLVKRAAWEKTWALQAAEDRGDSVGRIPVPPAYTAVDFVGGVAYGLRGKLDVPKERFVAHSEVPTADGRRRTAEDALYGWAGWTREERLRKLFALLETLDDEGVPAGERVGLHHLMFRYAADLGRTEPARAADLRADLRGEAGGEPTAPQLDAWVATHAAATSRGG